MADKSYEIIVRAEGVEQKSAVAGNNSGSSEKTYGEKSAASLEKGVKGLVSYASAKGLAEQLITAEIGRVELRTGAAEYQQRIQTVYSIGSSIANSVVSIGVGVKTGNLPLVLIGLATKGMQTLIGVLQKQKELNLKEANENVSINMATQRASTGGRRQ